LNSLRANFENSAKLLPLSVSHSARKIVWPLRSTRNSIRIAATLCIPRNRGRPGQRRPNRTFSAPSVCLLIDFQRPVPRVPRLLNSTRIVAGPITSTWGRCCSGSNDPTTDGRDHSPSPPGRSRIVRSSAIGPRRPTESFVLPPAKGVHSMPHKKERNLVFGPSVLKLPRH
jgi:hypothetical protein